MADQAQGNDQGQQGSTDNATATETVTALMPEIGPAGPPSGDDSPQVDTNLVLDTFFGTGETNPNPAPDQAQGSKGAGGQSQERSLAPSSAAPAANGGEGSPQPGPSSTQPGQGQESGAEAGAQTPGQQPSGSPDQQPAPQPLSIEDRLAIANAGALAEQNRQLMERLRAFESGAQPQGQGQQGQPNQTGAGQEQIQRLSVPDPIAAAIMNEDPVQAKQGMDMLLTATVHTAVMAAVAKVQPMIEARVNEAIGQLTSGQEVSKMETQFFERFPHLNNELYRPLIQQVTDEKFKAFPAAKWDEVMMDAVGATVTSKLQALGINPVKPDTQQDDGSGQSQQNGNGQQTPPRPKPAPMLDGSNRSGVPQGGGDFIKNTFL